LKKRGTLKFRRSRNRATLIQCSRLKTNMANLTISVSDEVLKRARIRALKENRSVNAMLGQYSVAGSKCCKPY